MAHRRNKSYLSTCCQKMSLPYQMEKTIPEGEVLEGGERRGNIQQCAFSPVHANTHTYTDTNTLERHGAVVSWQTNDRQMTCWNTSTRPDSNRPVRLCQWHLLWREGGASEACVSFYTNKTSAKHRMWLLPLLSTVSNLICLSIWVAASEDMVKGGMMERWNGKEGEKRWICCIGQRIWY